MKSIQKVIITSLFITMSLINVYAQISINEDGSSPDASAILDVNSTGKGMLVPRMTTSERTAIGSPATGLLVYDTDFNSFWYYANSTWNNLSNAILADADSDTKIQVEESSDDDIIRFDLGGTEFIRLDSGRIEVLNTGGSIFLGEDAGKNDDYTGSNVSIGKASGYSNTTGYSNLSIGTSSGYSNSSGFGNTFAGNAAGYSNNTGYRNTFLGYKSGEGSTSGYHNTFIGGSAGLSNGTGSENTLIGSYAGLLNVDSDGCVFVGYKAGYNETSSNKLYIENSNSSSPLIYGDFANDSVRINGFLSIKGEYTFPSTDGNSGQLITTDGNGNLYWSNINVTDDQTIDVFSLSGNSLQLSLEDDGESTQTVDLSSYLDNTDNQTIDVLSFSNNTLSLSLEDDGESTQTVDLSGLELSAIEDSDSDTKVNVGSNDKIIFKMDGTNYFTMEEGRISVDNTGNSIFIGESAGQNDDFSSNNNTGVGYRSLMQNTSGDANVAFGGSSLENCTGSFNTAIGFSSGIQSTTGDYNVFVGNYTGINITTGEKNVMIGNYAGGTANVSNKLFIDNSDTDSPLIYGDFNGNTLEFNGEVGIGTAPTNADLEVAYGGNTNSFALSNIGYLNTGGAGSGATYTGRFAIYTDGRIGGTAFIAHSDERIKNIIGQSNGQADLEVLNKIQIMDYTMKDQIKHDDKVIKKVIAQQVAKAYPQAVTANTTEIVPDIYQTAIMDGNGWISFNDELSMINEELKKSDKIQIIFEDKKEVLEVLEIKENRFRVSSDYQGNVFVYGKQVDDFHTVDYEAISMLNVSATQQLAKEVEQLKIENEKLKVNNGQLQTEVAKINQQQSEIDELKAMLQQLQAQLKNQSIQSTITEK